MLESNLHLFPSYSLLTEQMMAMKSTLMFKLPKDSPGFIGQKSGFNYRSKYQTLINNLDFSLFITEKKVDRVDFSYLIYLSIKERFCSNLEPFTNSKDRNTDTKIILSAETGSGKSYFMSYFIHSLEKFYVIFDKIRCFNEPYILINYLDAVLFSREININETWLSYIFSKRFKNRLPSNLEQLANSKDTNEYAEIISLTTEAGKNYLPSNYIEKNTVIYAGGDDYCAIGNSSNFMKNIKNKKEYINYIFPNELYIPFLSLKVGLSSLLKKALDLIEISTYTESWINNAILRRNIYILFSKENCYNLILSWAKLAFLNKGIIHIYPVIICNIFAKYSLFTKQEVIFNKGKTKDNKLLKKSFINLLIKLNNLDKNCFGCINIKFCLEKLWSKLIKLQYPCFYFAKIYIESLDKNLKIKIKVFHELQSTLLKCIFIPVTQS